MKLYIQLPVLMASGGPADDHNDVVGSWQRNRATVRLADAVYNDEPHNDAREVNSMESHDSRTGHRDEMAGEAAMLETMRHLASRWNGAATLLPGFELLAEGQPLATDRLATACGLSTGRVESILDRVRCRRDEQSRLIDLYGLTLEPTPHRLTLGRTTVYSCCALWTQVIPRLLGRPVVVESIDPVNQRTVRVDVGPEGPFSIDPSDTCATVKSATREAIRNDVGAAFCFYARYFSSRENAESFSSGSGAVAIMSVGSLWNLAGQLWAEIGQVTGDVTHGT